MLEIFNKYHKFHGFKMFKTKCNWEIQLMDKSRIDGAYLLLKRFKLRLKQFDKALEKLHTEKASTHEF